MIGGFFMKKIGIYCRVSTDRQASLGVSLDMQRDMLTREATKGSKGTMSISTVLYVDDGFSGKSLERPAMQKMISDIRKDVLDEIYVYDLSRLSRDIFDTESLLGLMGRHNVLLKCLYENVSMETATDRFRTRLTSLNNSYERERISERTRDSLRSIAEGGRYASGGRPPYGYARDGKKRLVIDDRTASVVREIFDLACSGVPFHEIASAAGTMDPGKRFDTRVVRDIIENERYAGRYLYAGREYDGAIPAIVDDGTFTRAQETVGRKSAKNADYIFDGLVRCDLCDEDMVCAMAYNKFHRKYFYYKCPSCGQLFSQIALDRHFIEHGMNEGKAAEDAKREKALRSTISALEGRIQRAREGYISGSFDEREYLELIMPLTERSCELREKLRAMKSGGGQKYAGLETNRQKKHYAEMRIRKIVVDPIAKEIRKIEYRTTRIEQKR